MQAIFLPLLFFALWCGLLVPVPSLILAWGEWIKRATPQAQAWRRMMSLLTLLICTLGALMWTYTMVADWKNEFATSARPLSTSLVISLGSWGSFPAIAISALAEGKLRKYLLVCAVGLFFFFNWTAGEAI
jgi:polyferredoxin